ncbi:hypothetical protein CXB51_036510 [Gossypium anomalum]|uniref:DUF4283 domain-containing protein n=1 Tax=Gossypium anomalum TaxID=47600 RepID=A0A8J5XNQ8_9ROSI|nr:hypothetical protein CXB51_036510 [Gossypium anomalum]
MDAENGYFLAKFKNSDDYKRALCQGPWHMYKRQVLQEIGKTIGKVAKLDFNTDNRVRGRFARMACGHYGHIKEIYPKGEMGLEDIGEDTLGDKTN